MSLEILPHPQGISRILFRLPLYLYEAGLGWMLRPFPFLILTTKGRRTGLTRHAVLEYRRHGSKLYIISGWGAKAHWYQNAMMNTDVTVQINGQEWKACAAPVEDPGEALRALYMFKRSSPIYDVILANMSSATTIDLRSLKAVAKEFTIVRLDLVEGQPPLRGIQAKYARVAPFILTVGIMLLVWMVWIRLSESET